jgi:hypothetical protein
MSRLRRCSVTLAALALVGTARAEEFLAKYLGGRAEPVGEIPGHAGVVK